MQRAVDIPFIGPIQIIAPVWVIIFALLPIFDWIFPSPEVIAELKKHHEPSLRICIGGGPGRRSFLLIPDSLKTTESFTIQREGDQLIYQKDPGILLLVIAAHSLMLFVAIRFSIPKWRVSLANPST